MGVLLFYQSLVYFLAVFLLVVKSETKRLKIKKSVYGRMGGFVGCGVGMDWFGISGYQIVLLPSWITPPRPSYTLRPFTPKSNKHTIQTHRSNHKAPRKYQKGDANTQTIPKIFHGNASEKANKTTDISNIPNHNKTQN